MPDLRLSHLLFPGRICARPGVRTIRHLKSASASSSLWTAPAAGLIIGGIAAIVILAVLFVVVGADRVIETLLAADPALVAATFGLALCWLIAWSLMLRTVLGSLDVDLSVTTSFLVYSGAVFANNVTPFGQAGGEPVAAALISQASGSRYETGLVGIASVDVLNVVPSISIVFLGVGYYATTAAIGERLEVVAVTVAVALIAAIVTAIGLGWRYRRVVVDRLPSAVGGLAGRLDRFDAATVEAGIADRLQNFFEDIERVGTSPGGWPPRSALAFRLAVPGGRTHGRVRRRRSRGGTGGPAFRRPAGVRRGRDPPRRARRNRGGVRGAARPDDRCSGIGGHRCRARVPRRRLLDADGDRRRVGVGARRPDGPVAATDRNSATFIWGAATSDVIHG